MIQYVSCVPFCSTWMNTCAYTALCPQCALGCFKMAFLRKKMSLITLHRWNLGDAPEQLAQLLHSIRLCRWGWIYTEVRVKYLAQRYNGSVLVSNRT